jgi:hypothetical protein
VTVKSSYFRKSLSEVKEPEWRLPAVWAPKPHDSARPLSTPLREIPKPRRTVKIDRWIETQRDIKCVVVTTNLRIVEVDPPLWVLLKRQAFRSEVS